MNYRIIETGSNYPDLLLHRDRNENGDESVTIFAIGVIAEDEDQFATEEVLFDSSKTAQLFIKDFSKASADQWCANNEISYEKTKKVK